MTDELELKLTQLGKLCMQRGIEEKTVLMLAKTDVLCCFVTC